MGGGRQVKGMLTTLKAAEVSAEKREFIRQLEREKRRATYLKAAQAVNPKDVLRAKAAAERRLHSVAVRQKAQQAHAVVASGTVADADGGGGAAAGGGGGGGFFSTVSASIPKP
jgi:hypothetical protein